MTAILEFFLLWYIFWPVVTIAILIDYFVTNKYQYSDSGDIPPFILGAIIVTLTLNYFPEVKSFVFTLSGSLIAIGGYVIIGGIVSLWKWVIVLMNFREKSATFDFHKYSTKVAAAPSLHDIDAIRYECKKDLIAHVFGYGTNICTGYVGNDNNKYYLIAKEFPIAYWWAHWPLFSLSVVLDPINRIIKSCVKYFADLYQVISKHFSVG